MEKTFDSFTFGPWWSAQCRWLLTETEEWWREVRMPGADLSDLPQEAQDEISAKWTPELVSEYALWAANPDPTTKVPGPVTPTPKQARLAQEAKAKLAEYEDGEFVPEVKPAPDPKPEPKPAPKAKRK
jgi:hypothetical protein